MFASLLSTLSAHQPPGYTATAPMLALLFIKRLYGYDDLNQGQHCQEEQQQAGGPVLRRQSGATVEQHPGHECIKNVDLQIAGHLAAPYRLCRSCTDSST